MKDNILKDFLYYFKDLSQIPRCPSAEQMVKQYLIKESASLSFSYKLDDYGNLLIYQENKYLDLKKNTTKIVLQSHLDMVCVQSSTSKHNFKIDPITLKSTIIEEENWITADDTSLGADNGAGIAIMLALMKHIYKKKMILPKQKALNFLFTIREEIGLIGASRLGEDMLKDSNYLISLDSIFGPDTILIGALGGITFRFEIVLKRQNNSFDSSAEIKISGLAGGHSSLDISERLNAINVIVKLLNYLENNKYNFLINNINGGIVANYIPDRTECTISFKKEDKNKILNLINDFKTKFINVYGEIESINIESTINSINSQKSSINGDQQAILLSFLHFLQFGSFDCFKNMTTNSLNLGVITTKMRKENIIFDVDINIRSLHSLILEDMISKIDNIIKIYNLSEKIVINKKKIVEFPAWLPNYDSKLLNITGQAIKNVLKTEPTKIIINATLENNIFKAKNSTIDLIAFGPVILNVHSIKEKLNVNSIAQTIDLIIKITEEL